MQSDHRTLYCVRPNTQPDICDTQLNHTHTSLPAANTHFERNYESSEKNSLSITYATFDSFWFIITRHCVSVLHWHTAQSTRQDILQSLQQKESAHQKVQWFCPGLELIFQVSLWPPVANHSDPFSQSEAQLLHGQWARSVCVYLCGSKVPWLTAQRYSVTQAALQECSSAQGWVVEPH